MINLKHLAAVTVLAVPLLFGGCATTNPDQLGTDVTNFVQKVQANVALLCSVVPNAADVVVLINSNAITQSVSIISHAICAALAQTRTGTVPSAVLVNGVLIHIRPAFARHRR